MSKYVAKSDPKSLVERQVRKYMKSVETFLKSKNGGAIPPEWGCSIMMLETYYREFCLLTLEIDKMDSLIEHGRWGDRPNPILAVRNSVAARLESLLKSLGLTFKEQVKSDLLDPVKEESPLEKFVQNKIEKR